MGEITEGTTLAGTYRVVRRLGSGNFGTVYEAIDCELERPVAVKILHDHWQRRDDVVARLRREAAVLSKLKHDGLPTVHCYLPDVHGIVMELLEGTRLDTIIQEGASLERRLTLLQSTLVALASVHSHNLVHRDIKPENVFVCADDQVKLLDFGLARVLADESMTVEGAFVGTAKYASPEQLRGTAIDARSDVFSFAATAFELLTSRSIVDSDADARRTILRGDHEQRASAYARRIPIWLDDLLAKCLSPDPALRPRDANAVLAEFKRHEGERKSRRRWSRRDRESSNDDRLLWRLKQLRDDDLAVVLSIVGEPVDERDSVNVERASLALRRLSGHGVVNVVRRTERSWDRILRQILRKVEHEAPETDGIEALEEALVGAHQREMLLIVKERNAFRRVVGDPSTLTKPEDALEAAERLAAQASHRAWSPRTHNRPWMWWLTVAMPVIQLQGPDYKRLVKAVLVILAATKRPASS